MWNKIKYFIKLKNNDTNYDDTEHIRIKFDSDDDLHFKKALKMLDGEVHITSVFEDDNIFLSQVIYGKYSYNLTKNDDDKKILIV